MTNTFPATYAKGDQRRSVHTAADAVKARFAGFKLIAAEDGVDYRDLQAQAKELEIPANQSAEELQEAINAELSKGDKQSPEKTPDKTVDTAGAPKPGPAADLGIAPAPRV